MSTWTDIRHPLSGGVYGLGYDAVSGNGLFEGSSPYQVDYSGLPQYPGFQPIYNPATQGISGNAATELAGIQPDQAGLQAYRNMALRSGPSPWATAATGKSYQDQAFSADTLAKNNASNVATARGALAAHGGLRSGASERLETSGGNNLLDQQRGTAQTGMTNRSQIGINDEQNRVAELGALPGMEIANSNFGLQKENTLNAARETDIQNQMAGQNASNTYNMGLYGNQSSIWAAGQQANATAASGKGGSWICTEAAKQMGHVYSREERTALKLLKEYANEVSPNTTRFYFAECHRLTGEMRQKLSDWKGVYEFIRGVIFQIICGDLEGAYERYREYVRGQISKFWLGCTDPAYTGVN